MTEFKRPNREPDLEVELYLFSTDEGGRKHPLWQGCRLPHDFGLPEEMNDGMYEFTGEPPNPGYSQTAFVWLLAPERGKRRLNFASFTIKERLNFPVATQYHVDIITHTNFLTGKFNAVWW